jgi:hypothetical protein
MAKSLGTAGAGFGAGAGVGAGAGAGLAHAHTPKTRVKLKTKANTTIITFFTISYPPYDKFDLIHALGGNQQKFFTFLPPPYVQHFYHVLPIFFVWC